MKVHLHDFSKIKSQKESKNSRYQGFSYYFYMMIEGSGSGSIPLKSGSGSWRLKNMWIRWIRIRNTEFFCQHFTVLQIRDILVWIRIRTPDLRIRILFRIRILLFSSVTFKMKNKNNYFASYFLQLHSHHFSRIKSHKEVGIKVFLTIFP